MGALNTLLLCTYFAYYVFYPNSKEDIELLKLDKSSKSVKNILFYTPFFSQKDYAFGFGNKPFVQNDCLVTNCFTTNDRQLLSKFFNFCVVKFPHRGVSTSWIHTQVFTLPAALHQSVTKKQMPIDQLQFLVCNLSPLCF